MADKKPNVSELARQRGIKPNIVHNRIASGWSLEKALNTPVRLRKSKPRKTVDDSSPTVDIAKQFQAVCAELEAAQQEIVFGQKRCKVVALTSAVLIALMASVIMYV